MTRTAPQRLNDMINAILTIRAHEARLDAAGIGRSEQVRLDAVVRQLVIVAEAAAHLPDEVLATEPSIPWQDVRGIRIVLDHGYHRVDPDLIWRTVDGDLPVLYAAAMRLRQTIVD